MLAMVFMGSAGKNGLYSERRGFTALPYLLDIDTGTLAPEENFALGGAGITHPSHMPVMAVVFSSGSGWLIEELPNGPELSIGVPNYCWGG